MAVSDPALAALASATTTSSTQRALILAPPRKPAPASRSWQRHLDCEQVTPFLTPLADRQACRNSKASTDCRLREAGEGVLNPGRRFCMATCYCHTDMHMDCMQVLQASLIRVNLVHHVEAFGPSRACAVRRLGGLLQLYKALSAHAVANFAPALYL